VKRKRVLAIKHEILIVDDQPGIRLLLKDVFTNEGYDVMLSGTGADALEKLCKYSFDLVMLDYRLPIVNGDEILKKMVKREILIPVILMSGLIEKIQEDFKEENMTVEVVAKPFNLIEIIELVKTMIK